MSDTEMQEPPSPDMDNEHGGAVAKRTAEREYSVEDLKRALHMCVCFDTTLHAPTSSDVPDGSGAHAPELSRRPFCPSFIRWSDDRRTILHRMVGATGLTIGPSIGRLDA